MIVEYSFLWPLWVLHAYDVYMQGYHLHKIEIIKKERKKTSYAINEHNFCLGTTTLPALLSKALFIVSIHFVSIIRKQKLQVFQ